MVEELAARVTQVELDFTILKEGFAQEKMAFGDAVSAAVAQCQNKIDIVINDAQREFSKIREESTVAQIEIVEQTRSALVELQQRVGEIERAGPGHGGGLGSKFKGYLPLEKSFPDKIGDKVEEWRGWKKNVMGYLDTITPGMKSLLEEVAKKDDTPNEDWFRSKEAEYGRWVTGDREKLWRALTALTEGDAQKP